MNKFSFFATFFVFFFFVNISFAQVVTVQVANSNKPIVATTSKATTSKKIYKLPKEGVRIKATDANYSFFPEQLSFAPGRKILIISRKWQTACVYDESGKIFVATSTTMLATTTQYMLNKPFCIQSATGKKDLPTELGLYNIQTKNDANYKSTFYTNDGEKPEKKDDGAPMPYAMHIGRIIGMSPEQKLWFDFSDGTAIHEKQTFNKNGAMPFVSHGCVAIEKGMGKTLQNILGYGELVLVINENIPNSLPEMISIYQ